MAGDITVHSDSAPAAGALARAGDAVQSTLAMIERAARDSTVDVQKMQQLMDLQERVLERAAKAEFIAAFSRLMKVMPRITKKGTLEYPINKNDPDGPKRKISNFAKWEDIDTAIRPLLSEEGFSLSFSSVQRAGDGGGLIVTGHLGHVYGYERDASMPLPLDTSGGKNNLQGYGSTLQYGKRYTAGMLLNLVFEGEDDDGKRGGDEFINSVQAAEIRQLIEDGNVPLEGFLDYMGTRSVDEIQVADFPRAMNALRKRKPGPRQ